MSNQQLTISYNGHKTAVTCVGNNTYLIQITSSPYYVQFVSNDDGTPKWIEVSTGMQTPLSKELGELIEDQLTQ